MRPDTRKILLKAAMHAVSYFGIRKTTVDLIAKVSDMSVATLYYYYSDKTEALTDAISEAGKIYISQLSTMVAADRGTSLKVLSEVVSARWDFILNNFRYDYTHSTSIASLADERIELLIANIKIREKLMIMRLIQHTVCNISAAEAFSMARTYLDKLDQSIIKMPDADDIQLLREQERFTVDFWTNII